MNHERWKAAVDLYFQAIEAPDARAFLDHACDGDPELRQEVELLLKQDHDTVHLFDRQACIDDLEAARDRQLLAPGSTLGQYQILELLGSGGSSDVYKAFDSRLERNVALKVFSNATLTADFRARFAREAKVAASLNHPNIATVYDVGEAGRHWYIAMEYVDGVTLREKFNDSTCSISERLDYLAQAAGALARAHATGLVHCDLKPENIMLTGDGLVKVLDFGLARQVHTPAADQPRAGIEGTVGYMSPEQAERQPVGAHSDVFAFGCMLFEAAANRLPFLSPSVAGALDNLRNAVPPRLSAFAQTTADRPPGAGGRLSRQRSRGAPADHAGRLHSPARHRAQEVANGQRPGVGNGRAPDRVRRLRLLAVAKPVPCCVGCGHAVRERAFHA